MLKKRKNNYKYQEKSEKIVKNLKQEEKPKNLLTVSKNSQNEELEENVKKIKNKNPFFR